ncbi:DNA recombination protein RmuC [Pelistega sp. NLN82]|uniref:DNA recombination protein RmuC n=1 Tax=Pelistega ratti TaxID=2652177 RepID=A0A6L9Y7X5_9BURK|nr:DNA recombination protein RmuC [Pelistega ratti]NEN75957.1 DNA recombination protein RmuC [Pelistega ratti]
MSQVEWYFQVEILWGIIALCVIVMVAQLIYKRFNRLKVSHQISQLDEHNMRLIDSLSKTENALQQMRHDYYVLEETLDEREQELARRESTIEEKDKQLIERKEQISRLETEQRELYHQYNESEKALARLHTEIEQKEKNLVQQQMQFDKSKAELSTQFENLANSILEKKSEKFELQNKNSIEQLLQPFKEQIESFKKRVNDIHSEASKDQTALSEQIKFVKDLGLKMSEEAQNLASALKGNKKILGNWGEVQLENALEQVGLQKDLHYLTQQHYKDEAGNTFIPDVVLILPDHKHIIVDSKVSLNAYQAAMAEANTEKVAHYLKIHLRDVKNHIDELAHKDYSALMAGESLGFVLMFMPIEAAYIEALKQDPALFQYAYHKGVVMVSQTTLMPTLRTIHNLWKIANSNQQVLEIGDKAVDIYNQVVTIAEHLQRLGIAFTQVSKHYNNTITSFAGNRGLIGKIERFKTLSTKAAKTMPELDITDASVDMTALYKVLPEKTDTNE